MERRMQGLNFSQLHSIPATPKWDTGWYQVFFLYFLSLLFNDVVRYISVGTATRYELGDPGIESR